LSPAGIVQRALERADMVGSSFVSPDEAMRFTEAAFQEFLGLLGTRFDELLLRRASVTAFAGEESVQLGAQLPRRSAGWTLYSTTLGSVAIETPDGESSAYSAQHTVASTDAFLVIPITNMTFGGDSAPNATVEIVCKSTSFGDIFAYFEIVSKLGTNSPSVVADTWHGWVNLTTGAVGQVGNGSTSDINIECDVLDPVANSDVSSVWKKVRIIFKPKGPRHALRIGICTTDAITTRSTASPMQIASVRVLQATPFKKFLGVRVTGGKFLRRRQLRDLESYSLSGQPSSNEPEGYILRADNGRDGMPELLLMPTPASNCAMQYYFVPVFTLTDAAGMSLVASWDEFVVITSAMKMKDKEESDVSVLMAEKATLVKGMLEDLEPIDASEPAQVARFNGPGVDPYSQMFQEEVF
jgi:hypothetical protein